MNRRTWAVAGALLAACAVAVPILGSLDHAAELPLVVPTPTLPSPSPHGPGPEESPLLPPVPTGMGELASTLAGQYRDHPQFASAQVPLDRSRLVIHWHGEVPADLQTLLDQFSAVPVEIRQTRYSPAELKEAAQQLMRDLPHVSASMRDDAAGLRVRADVPEPDRAALQRDVRAATTFPVDFEFGGVIPATGR